MPKGRHDTVQLGYCHILIFKYADLNFMCRVQKQAKPARNVPANGALFRSKMHPVHGISEVFYGWQQCPDHNGFKETAGFF